MIKIISAISEGSYIYNEDSILVSDDFFAVIDGATGLNNIHLTNSVTDAAWLSKRLCEFLRCNLLNFDIPVSEILKEAAKIIKSELDSFGYGEYEYAYPSASVAIVRKNNDILECCTLGDAPIIILQENQTIKCIYDDTVTIRDSKIIDQMIDIQEKTGCSIFEAKKRVNHMLIKNRLEMNHENAYYIFDPTGAGIDHMKVENINIADVLSISLMSDGYYSAMTCFHIIKNHNEFIRLLSMGKAQEIMQLLRKMAMKDTNLNQYPRFKIMDDASVIVAIKK